MAMRERARPVPLQFTRCWVVGGRWLIKSSRHAVATVGNVGPMKTSSRQVQVVVAAAVIAAVVRSPSLMWRS